MEVTVQEESTQPVFSRRRLHLTISFEEAVPARGTLLAALAEKQDVAPSTVAIRQIRSRFGGGIADAEAYIYENAEALAKFEQKHIVERTSKTMAAPAKEAPADETEPSEEPAAEEAEEAPESSEEAEKTE